MVTVIGCGGLVVPTVWPTKLRLVVDKTTVGASPEPDKVTDCGLPLALSATVSPPLRLPAAAGVNITLIVQLALAAKGEAQLFVCEKSPLVAMPVIVSGPVPGLLRMTGCAALVLPTF